MQILLCKLNLLDVFAKGDKSDTDGIHPEMSGFSCQNSSLHRSYTSHNDYLVTNCNKSCSCLQ